MVGHLVQDELGGEEGLNGLFAPVHRGLRFADHLDVAHGIVEAVHAEVKIIQAERLLVLGWIRLLGDRQHGLAGVEHVIAPHLIRAVGEAVRMLVIGGGLSSNSAVCAAPQETTTMPPRKVSADHPFSAVYHDPVTAVPSALVLSLITFAWMSRVTLPCSSAGRTASTSESDLAWTTQGNPSQSMQRTQRLYGMFASLSMMPHGEWNG